MLRPEDVAGIRRYLGWVRAAALVVIGAGGWCAGLSLDPLMGHPASRGAWLGLGGGACLVAFGVAGLIASWRWERKALRPSPHAVPIGMRMVLRREAGAGEEGYTAQLLPGPSADGPGLVQAAAVPAPGWDVSSLLGKEIPVRVYFDPRSCTPRLIETDLGLLWLGGATDAALGLRADR